MTWEIFMRIAHIIGTVLGVGGATFAEIFYERANRDGMIDPAAGGYLKITYTVLRLGMILLVLSGFGFLLLLRLEGRAQYIYSDRLWAKLVITLVILLNALLLQTRKVPLWLGSTISLTSWYAALVLGIWRGLPAGFWAIMAGYVLAIGVVALALGIIRKMRGGKA